MVGEVERCHLYMVTASTVRDQKVVAKTPSMIAHVFAAISARTHCSQAQSTNDPENKKDLFNFDHTVFYPATLNSR